MRPTRWTDTAAIIVGFAVVAFALLSFSYDDLPTVPRTLLITLGLLALVGISTYTSLRARLERRAGAKPITPLQTARYAPFGKALSAVGAALVGSLLGLLAIVVGDLDLAAHRSDAITAGIGLVPAILTLLSGLGIERLLRVPPSADPDEQERSS